MSHLHYRTPDFRKDRFDTQYQNYYTPSSNTPSVRTPSSEIYRNENYSGWTTPELATSGTAMPREGRGDPPFPDANMHITNMHSHDEQKRRDSTRVPVEKIQARLRFFEDSNKVMQTRNKNLITENRALVNQLEEERIKSRELEEKLALTQRELRQEKERLAAELNGQTSVLLRREDTTSTTDLTSQSDQSVQVWSVCKGCHRKLESNEKDSVVTITKSELEMLEKDMQTLRDAVIAREEEWDKMMEREQNYRQQLARLTAETITASHLSEARQERLQAITDALKDRESDLKTSQKEIARLNKIIYKLNKRQRELEENAMTSGSDLSERDQKFIGEIVRRVSGMKSKHKSKSKSPSPDKSC